MAHLFVAKTTITFLRNYAISKIVLLLPPPPPPPTAQENEKDYTGISHLYALVMTVEDQDFYK
jgi:hypothetical protein